MQDDEYLAALQADREKELKAREEAEARRLEEEAARQAACEEERRREEESRRKLEEEQVMLSTFCWSFVIQLDFGCVCNLGRVHPFRLCHILE